MTGFGCRCLSGHLTAAWALVRPQTLWLASAFQLWRLENVLADGAWTSDGYDRLFVPMAAHTTSDIDAHDIALDHQGQLVFINTLFSCLARISSRWSFEPIWHPAFIGRVAAEDRCHLNGLAMETSQPAYVTACSQTDTAEGWRDVRRDGGCLVDVRRNEVVEWLQIERQVDELYDVITLPGVECPKLLGLKTDEIRRQVWFVEGERIVSWSASEPRGKS